MRYCEPDSQKSKAPLPWIGMYVAAASLICFLAIVADAFSAFRNKKIWFPCKFFTINAATLTLLGVSMKMPLDVSSYMNGGSDQLAKLSSTVMMCIAIGNFMPSLGPMDDKDIFTNIIALGILIITVIVNVCIQLVTCAIPNILLVKHVLVNFFMFLLLVISTFSAVTVATTKKYLELKYGEIHKESLREQIGKKITVEKLKENVNKYWMMAETGSPQFVMARSVTCSASGVICLMTALILARVVYLVSDFAATWESDYALSTFFIFVIQTATVGVGIIGPVCRWFTAIKLKCSKKSTKGFKTELKLESYWIKRLVEWKKSSIVLQIRGPKLRKLVQRTKNLVLNLCIMVQVMIVVTSKLTLLIPVVLVRLLMSCYRCCCELFKKPVCNSTSLMKSDIGDYVLLLEGEEKLTQSTLKNISKATDHFIVKANKQQPRNLIKLLQQKSTGGFECMLDFHSDKVSLLDSQEPPNCWALPLVTLTSIAIAISKINDNFVDRLVRSVSEGLSYVRHVDETMDTAGNLINSRDAADEVWLGVELESKWLDEDLTKIASKGCRETFQILADCAQKIVIKYKADINGRPDGNRTNWPIKVIAANSMYRICKSLLLNDEGNNQQINHDKLFMKLFDIMIAGKNYEGGLNRISTIEKMEKSVQFAAQLLGETEEILKIFEQHELLCLHNVDQFASIDEWRAKMGQANPCDSPSSSDNNLVASSSGITDIEIHFLQIKFTAIGVYLDSEIVGHLEQWKGKTGKDLAENDDFFEALISAPVENFLRVVVIKEIKGSQYGVQLESAVRDRSKVLNLVH
ncbi:hypothetical protein TEA_006371 [Camellia sinensis var. sinensis]|uniref:Chalcone-flavonone isomerase family protein n=1 Tax=Camellia sinensis var. sinensis TaxID=542762 RepID=A0A4S4E031_CAMSN|nr:hypothetical protein TEA_006371 [Camellia sinensis var. sinensis]